MRLIHVCLDIPSGGEGCACVKQHISNIKIAKTSKVNIEAHICQQDLVHIFDLHRLIVHSVSLCQCLLVYYSYISFSLKLVHAYVPVQVDLTRFSIR